MAVPPSAPADDETAQASQGSRPGLMVLCAVALLVLAVSLVGGNDTSADSSGPPLPAQPGTSAPPASPASPAGRALPRAKPERLLIPEISVDAPFTDLAIGKNGQLKPPPADDTNLVGWYAGGVSPGEKGTSVIAGHVDTKTSAAVFARLDRLNEGDVFKVERADGRTASFTVDSLETFEKDDFPSERVYGDADRPEVRLITCAGDYDHKVKDYTDNLVVFAHLT
ncbi:class F sortase [Streptomyces olivaceus]|uniref:class F sortase n=1 Tax=Streptomyces olivaceus TaxID=47716 RepID=UPI00087832D9|nr:class F sortase [Streptomyces olivaceus]AOW85414.1 class F sortase [Streptomyces olivaceus]MBZ6084321.1 class F sortase [Streptomyces olivaceus]MBZ6202600.1 class F sortase [Streptomyces olivaceus]MBZ6307122.1 class F sortase [Streptomyces olivaceus]MBZ6321017.1 class F sortase [Streptomyces olivaceus]